jgi:hypothetical protein
MGAVKTPTLVASIGGIAVAACGFRIPAVVMEPLTRLSEVAVPAALLAFGLSLAGGARFPRRGSRGEVAAICALKLVMMPLLTYAVGRYVADLPASELIPVTVLAALPTAQNVYAVASAYQASESLARETGLITTIVSLPTVGILVGVLGSTHLRGNTAEPIEMNTGVDIHSQLLLSARTARAPRTGTRPTERSLAVGWTCGSMDRLVCVGPFVDGD